MKAKLIVILAMVFVAATVISLRILGPRQQYQRSMSNTQVPDNAVNMQDVLELPIYSKARNVIRPTNPAEEWAKTTFETSDVVETVVEYYEVVMGANGWDLSNKTTNTSALVILEYYRKGSYHDVGYDLFLNITIGEDEVLQSDTLTFVSLALLRMPDPTRVPLYPGGRSEKVVYITNAEGEDIEVRSFVVGAPHSDVTAFFQRSLIAVGWNLITTYNDNSSVVMTFECSAIGPLGGVLWGELTLKASASSDVETDTNVELRIKGYNIHK